MLRDSVVIRVWAADILLALAAGPQRFNRLMELPGISDRVLTLRLRELEDAGLLSREVIVSSPVRVSYGLTDAGRKYVAPLEQMAAIARTAEEVSALAS